MASPLGQLVTIALLLQLACDKRSEPTAPPDAATAPLDGLPAPLRDKVNTSCGTDEGLGEKLKPFALQTVDGKPVSHESWRGRVLLVNFWATWCRPCRKELPELDELHRHYANHGLTLVAIASDEDPAVVEEYAHAHESSAVVIGARDYALQYGSPEVPFSFVVDTEGVIRASFRGYRPKCMGKVEAEIRRALEARDINPTD